MSVSSSCLTEQFCCSVVTVTVCDHLSYYSIAGKAPSTGLALLRSSPSFAPHAPPICLRSLSAVIHELRAFVPGRRCAIFVFHLVSGRHRARLHFRPSSSSSL